MNKWIWVGAGAVLLAAAGWWIGREGPGAGMGAEMGAGMGGEQAASAASGASGASGARPASGEMVAVTLPQLDGAARRGQQAFGAICAACHGPNAGGLEGKGPPLVHRLYVPGHHGDMAIRMAAQRGVQSHHWRFGNMPPIEGLTDADLTDIIAFIRAVQRANGLS